MRLFLWIVLGVYGLAVGALTLFQRHLIYPGAFRGPAITGERPPPEGTQTVSVETADGERLFGFWRAPDPGCGIVLTFHGNGSRPESGAARFTGGPWRAHGWGVLAIAYRGYPGSTGSPSEAGLLADGLAAFRAAQARAPEAPLLLHGHSLGAAVAVAATGHGPHLGLYLEAPFDSMKAVVAGRYPFVPTSLLWDTYRSDRRLPSKGNPVLIVHGADDSVVPPSLGRRLAAIAGPRARFEEILGDHVSILGARDTQAEALFRPGGAPGCRTGLAGH